ncbi:hypothetical protein HK104_001613, partial [Borealophlyctis nickersoniae]
MLYLLSSSCKHLVFHEILSRNPFVLTFEVADALLAEGALLPKYLVERAFRESQDAPDRLPEGTVEFLVAQGYKLYGDTMRLSMPFANHSAASVESPDESDFAHDDHEEEISFAQMAAEGPLTDDVGEFELCFANTQISIENLKRIVEKHGYTPALQPPRTKYGWNDYWDKLYRLVSVDPKLTLFLCKHSGCDSHFANDEVVARALQDSKTTPELLKWLMEQGFELSAGAVVEVLASSDGFPIYSNEAQRSLNLLKEVLPAGQLKEYAEFALIPLLRESARQSLRAADFLITEFDLDEEAVGRALFVNPYDVVCRKGAAFVTTFGRAYGGMRDGLWQLILGRYGVEHPFAAACMNDLIVGGTIPPPSSKFNARYSGISSATESSSASTSSSVFRGNWNTGEDEDSTNDSAARDSLEAMVEAGVSLEPATFGPVAKAVLETKRLAIRQLDWLARIERGLLETAANKGATEYERRKWSRVRWVAAFQRCVLNDPEYREALAPVPAGEGGATTMVASTVASMTAKLPGSGFIYGTANGNGSVNGSNGSNPSTPTTPTAPPPPSPRPVLTTSKSFFQSLTSLTESITFTDTTDSRGDIRRFHACVSQLVSILEAPRPDRVPRSLAQSSAVKEAVAALEGAVRDGGPFGR